MKIKVDGKPMDIKSLSELTFYEFNEMIVKREVVDLVDYLSVFTKKEKDDLFKADIEIKAASMPLLYASVFNCEVDKVLKEKKQTLEFRGKFLAMESIALDTFGRSYMFELRRMKYDEGAINHFELCLYALALGLAEANDYSDTDDIYMELERMNWVKVLPQAFFLLKRTKMPRLQKLTLSIISTWGLKAIRSKMHYSLKRLVKLERKSR